MLFLNKNHRSSYDYEKFFQTLMLQLMSLDHTEENLSGILKTILNIVDSKNGSLFLFHDSSKAFQLKNWVGEKPLIMNVTHDFEFILFLQEFSEIVFKDELKNNGRYLDIKNAALHYFTQLSSIAVIPLLIKGQWVGFLNIGRSQSIKEFGEGERALFKVIGYWLTQFISNSLLFEQIKNQNKKLEEVNELKNQLMANVTHELRTPLHGIIGLTDVLLDGADGPLVEDQKRHLEMVKEAGNSLLEIVNNMLSLIKVEASKGEIEVKRLYLSQIVTDVASLFEGILRSKENRLYSEIDKNLAIYGNEDQIRTLLMNLVGNAAKFTDRGEIVIQAGRSGQMVKVCVKDNGIGIAKNDQAVIFEEFRQADGTITRSYGGTGLGLAIAKRIVQIHGGRIWVDSQPGQGSEFYFTLPLKPNLS